MKKIILLVALIGVGLTAYSQERDSTYTAMAVFAGCENEQFTEFTREFCSNEMFRQYIVSVPYPEAGIETKMEGQVFIVLTIDTVGYVSNVEIRESSGYEVLDNAAVDYIKAMPRWVPAYEDGKKVASKILTPLSFNKKSKGYKALKKKQKKESSSGVKK